ncbi:hypothetical protein PGTUg99_001821 [Puccinia graminis f. sp. tritici]|uniref:Uncharacterized protein n=1 Tax=Puccinia graminis f. sp. tritici TaxID=56615 RepID=A0A5B0LZN0_PUCGR|nr:hypothetical protein PGTUg99_001821 [Puccinia graminis f. sp. tritici]
MPRRNVASSSKMTPRLMKIGELQHAPFEDHKPAMQQALQAPFSAEKAIFVAALEFIWVQLWFRQAGHLLIMLALLTRQSKLRIAGSIQ